MMRHGTTGPSIGVPSSSRHGYRVGTLRQWASATAITILIAATAAMVAAASGGQAPALLAATSEASTPDVRIATSSSGFRGSVRDRLESEAAALALLAAPSSAADGVSDEEGSTLPFASRAFRVGPTLHVNGFYKAAGGGPFCTSFTITKVEHRPKEQVILIYPAGLRMNGRVCRGATSKSRLQLQYGDAALARFYARDLSMLDRIILNPTMTAGEVFDGPILCTRKKGKDIGFFGGQAYVVTRNYGVSLWSVLQYESCCVCAAASTYSIFTSSKLSRRICRHSHRL